MSDDKFAALLTRVKVEFPRFSVKERDKSWLRWIFWPLQKVLRQDFSEFTTTIGSTMYVGPNWAGKSPTAKYMTLRHEIIHTRQFHRWPLGPSLWVLNHVLMAFCYLFVLPLLWSFRAKFEREGYAQTLLVEHELYGGFSEARMEQNATWIAATFGGSAYFFMWRKKAAHAWAIETQRKIMVGEITNPKDRVVAPPSVPATPPAA